MRDLISPFTNIGRVRALVTLGSPHNPPPQGSAVASIDQTRGLLTYINNNFPGSALSCINRERWYDSRHLSLSKAVTISPPSNRLWLLLWLRLHSLLKLCFSRWICAHWCCRKDPTKNNNLYLVILLGAYEPGVKYTCVVGTSVQGALKPSPEALLAYSSYAVLCGDGSAKGDGKSLCCNNAVVTITCAHLVYMYKCACVSWMYVNMHMWWW